MLDIGLRCKHIYKWNIYKKEATFQKIRKVAFLSYKLVNIVTHRVSTLHSVDRILVFDHRELVQTKGVKAVSAI